jgi:predicted CXXCH cytochrome family protein
MPHARAMRIFIFALGAALIWAAPAFAYDEASTGWECAVCHDGAEDVSGVTDNKGPHGGYTTTSRKCAACHSVHAAPADGVLLLPGATITETCFTCHDGTGGRGVYGTVGSVASGHSVDTTNAVPGGDPSTGETATYTFSNPDGTMNCADCHSPHANDTVEPFTGDRLRVTVSEMTTYTSTRLLKNRPNGVTETVTYYGSDWCVACHRGRGDSDTLHNHPVEAPGTAGQFHYENVAVLTGYDETSTEMGELGRDNLGYVMPWDSAYSTRTAAQQGHDPICQQCHEDARDVGDDTIGTVSAAEAFDASLDGTTTGNPTYQDFPHESPNERLLIETNDDLCTNCHPPAQLP